MWLRPLCTLCTILLEGRTHWFQPGLGSWTVFAALVRLRFMPLKVWRLRILNLQGNMISKDLFMVQWSRYTLLLIRFIYLDWLPQWWGIVDWRCIFKAILLPTIISVWLNVLNTVLDLFLTQPILRHHQLQQGLALMPKPHLNLLSIIFKDGEQ